MSGLPYGSGASRGRPCLVLFLLVQTELPFTRPDINPEMMAYIKECYTLDEAQQLVRMSRTGFFRFRGAYGIGVATGRKVHGAEVVRGLERARGLPGKGPFPSLREYALKLLTREEVCRDFGFKLTSLYKLRVRHRVPLLPGGTFHCEDIIAAIEAERHGERRDAGSGPIRVMTRMRNPRKVAKTISARGAPSSYGFSV